jgi:hypothetical protein
LAPGGSKRRRVDRRRKADEIVGKIETAENGPDDRHDDVVDQRFHDTAESATDDDTDGKVHDVASGNKCLELIEHPICLPLMRRDGPLL